MTTARHFVSAIALALAGCGHQVASSPPGTPPTEKPRSPVAAPVAKAPTLQEKLEYCKVISDLAEAVMKSRQQGVPMADAMKVASTKEMRYLVQEAYDSPQYTMEPFLSQQRVEFQNQAYLACSKGVNISE